MILQKEVKFSLGLGVILLLLAAALFVNKEEEPIADTPDDDGGTGTVVADNSTDINEKQPDIPPPSDDTPPAPDDTTVVADDTTVVAEDDFKVADDVAITPDSTDTVVKDTQDDIIFDDGTDDTTVADTAVREPRVETGYRTDNTTVIETVDDTVIDTADTPSVTDIDIVDDTVDDTPVRRPYSGDGFEYEIKKGDTYQRLAKEYYGKNSEWIRIDKANPGVVPTELMPGQRIIIPGPVIKKPEDDDMVADTPPTPVTGRKYKVKKGDTLGSISRQFYKSSKKWRDIMKANKLRSEYDLKAGSTIILPGISEVEEIDDSGIPTLEIPGPDTAPVGTIRKTHVVQKGETLWAIAELYYGNGLKYKDIIAANRGMDKDNLKVGQKINIPGLKGSSTSAGTEYFIYIIQEGDMLSDLAERFLGTSSRWREIQVLNNNIDPKKLFVGRQIKIPGTGPAPSSARSSSRSKASSDDSGVPDVFFEPGRGVDSYLGGKTGSGSTYTVARGDNLGVISRKVYGTGEYWKQIRDANPRLKDNPDLLYVGMKLKIPAIANVRTRSVSSQPAPTTYRRTTTRVSEPEVTREPVKRDSFLSPIFR